MSFYKNKSANIRISLTLVTALLVCVVAALAGTSLWLLSTTHNQHAHATATRAVLEQGKLITARIADQPIVRSASPDDPGWKQFSRLVNGLHTLENGLQYVSVTKDGVTVFHEQMTAIDEELPSTSSNSPTNLAGQITLSRRILKVGKETVPVVVFNSVFNGDDGKVRTVEIALRKDTVGREEETAATAIASMFKVSLATTLISFTICVILVVWMMQREIKREKIRREQEHFVFAGVLANGIAHDFRNPMSSLQLDIQMIEKAIARGEKDAPERISQLAKRAVNTMNRMDKVFKEFMYLSKPVSDNPVRINLNECIRESVEMLTANYEQAGVRIDQKIEKENIEVLADQTSIRRAIVNILTNALQFSKKGDTVSISISTSGHNALIDIADQGPGIAKSEHRKIFEMFVSTRPGGTGLGLFLAKTAIERAGGNIKVLDIQGGACFRITIPVAENR
ncbi:MAG: hypothetical protein A2283_21345 [Lentisphaerae bacterium RIFOXYA12_FULL_48_11]|nr:MAG: hypothetical protein A2283_21345 [Lentisphaerae bacterium RIFOXYA12_FULL_48_11]